MKEKYLIVLSKVTKEGLNETHEIKLYDSFYCDEELLYFLHDDVNDILVNNFRRKDVVEVFVFEVCKEGVNMYESVDLNISSDAVSDYLKEPVVLSEEDQEFSLFQALLKEVRIRKNKKHYMVVLVKDVLNSDGEVVRKILAKPKFDDSSKLMEFLSGLVNTTVIGGRIESLLGDKKEYTQAFLYEWSENSYGSCFEYSGYINHGAKGSPSDFFKVKLDKDKGSTLMHFLD